MGLLDGDGDSSVQSLDGLGSLDDVLPEEEEELSGVPAGAVRTAFGEHGRGLGFVGIPPTTVAAPAPSPAGFQHTTHATAVLPPPPVPAHLRTTPAVLNAHTHSTNSTPSPMHQGESGAERMRGPTLPSAVPSSDSPALAPADSNALDLLLHDTPYQTSKEVSGEAAMYGKSL